MQDKWKDWFAYWLPIIVPLALVMLVFIRLWYYMAFEWAPGPCNPFHPAPWPDDVPLSERYCR